MIPQNLAPLRKKSSDLGNCIQILFFSCIIVSNLKKIYFRSMYTLVEFNSLSAFPFHLP